MDHRSAVTDPATTGSFENLTASYVVEKLPWPPGVQQALRERLDELLAFRRRIERARMKLVAHADLHAHGSDEPLGAFPEGHDSRFLQALQEFVDIAHEHLFGCPFALDAVTHGDAADLVVCLQRGVAMDALLQREPLLCDEVLSRSEFRDA